MAHLAPDLHGADLPAVASILVASQAYLTLPSETTDKYNGIDLNAEDGWKRIEAAVALLSDSSSKMPPQRGRKLPAMATKALRRVYHHEPPGLDPRRVSLRTPCSRKMKLPGIREHSNDYGRAAAHSLQLETSFELSR